MKKTGKQTIFRVLPLLLLGSILFFAMPVTASKDLTEKTEGIFTYIVEGDTVTLTGCDRDATGKITIPATIEGKPVIKIADHAFWLCRDITGFSLPDSIVSIGPDAFSHTGFFDNEENWENDVLYLNDFLIAAKEEISGPFVVREGIRAIAGHGFRGCREITSISLPRGLERIGEGAFVWTDSLAQVHVPGMVDWLSITFEDDSANPLSGGWQSDVSLFVGNTDLSGTVVIPTGTTKIGPYAFAGYTSIKSLTLPASLQEVGTGAFDGDHRFEKVIISDLASWCAIDFEDASANPLSEGNPTLLLGEENIRDLVVPEGVTKIGAFAFYNCALLESVQIPASVTDIGRLAFDKCFQLETITVNAQNQHYEAENNVLYNKGKTVLILGTSAAAASFTVPGTVVTIEESAFFNHRKLTSLQLPDSVQTIGENAFSSCQDLETVTLGKGLKTIEAAAFRHCSLTALQLPDGVQTIGENAFFDCNITSLRIPDSVQAVGHSAFAHCENLETLTLGTGLKILPHSLFSSCGIKEVEIPDSVEQIEYSAFESCAHLNKVTFGKGLKTIGASAFNSCTALKRVHLPGVLSIESSAFENCTSLSCMILPKSLISIEHRIVDSCPSLDTIYFCGTQQEWNEIDFLADDDDLWEKNIVFVPNKCTKTRISPDKKTLKTNAFHVDEDCHIVLALYKGKQLVGLVGWKYEDTEFLYEATVAYDTVKIMAWKSDGSLLPLFTSEKHIEK